MPKRKPKKPMVNAPLQFDKDEEHNLTEMQASFVWHYTEGACGSQAANKMLNGKDYPNVVKAIRIKQDELREKYAITPQKTGTMLWKIMESAYDNGQFNAAVSAIKELNQLGGLSINRSQNININANLEKMSRDQIKERLGQLLGSDTSTYSDKDK
jgi:hypothetical protein